MTQTRRANEESAASAPLNCVNVKEMTAIEALQAMKKLAGGAPGPFGAGAWEGELRSKLTGAVYEGPHLGLFNDHALVTLFGPMGDAESEHMCVLLLTALNFAGVLADRFKELDEAATKLLGMLPSYGVGADLYSEVAVRRLKDALRLIGEAKHSPRSA